MRQLSPMILRGTWDTTFGEMTLDTKENIKVTGWYKAGTFQGEVEGTIEGTLLVGRWRQTSPTVKQGYFKFLFDLTGKFNGLWSYDDEALLYPWQGKKI